MNTDSDRQPWADEPLPGQAMLDWHDEARVRDEAYLALGPVDDTETRDGPWAGGPRD